VIRTKDRCGALAYMTRVIFKIIVRPLSHNCNKHSVRYQDYCDLWCIKNMDMEILWIILANLISAAAVFVTVFFLIRQFFSHEQNKRLLELKMQHQNMLTPIRLQAYERLVLFLERISPNSSVTRVYLQGMTAFQMQTALIHNIREEFEHNLSQQVYVSNPAWELVRNVKEETIKMVNIAASKLNDSSTGTDLSTTILELSMQSSYQPGPKAVEYLKNEIRQLF
jgi:hypothetical protein